MRVVSFKVSDEEYAMLRELAAFEDRPLSVIIRAALEEYVQKKRAKLMQPYNGKHVSIYVMPRGGRNEGGHGKAA